MHVRTNARPDVRPHALPPARSHARRPAWWHDRTPACVLSRMHIRMHARLRMLTGRDGTPRRTGRDGGERDMLGVLIFQRENVLHAVVWQGSTII